MKSVIIKNIEDLRNINEDVTEIEFFDLDYFGEVVEIVNGLEKIESLTFTNILDIDIQDIPKYIKNLSFYNCTLEDVSELKNFSMLRDLEITGSEELSFEETTLPITLKTINLNYSKVVDTSFILNLLELEEISIVESDIENYDFLLEIKNLKRVVIDIDNYEKQDIIMRKLENQGVLVTDIMGGVFRYV